jgi:hypothetical protein
MNKGASSCVFCRRQELVPLFICWVTLAYTAVRRKVSAVCQDDYRNHWAKDMHIKDRWKLWCHMASLGWKGLTCKNGRKGVVNSSVHTVSHFRSILFFRTLLVTSGINNIMQNGSVVPFCIKWWMTLPNIWGRAVWYKVNKVLAERNASTFRT